MNVNRLKIRCTEIFKTINVLNPSYLKTIFNKSPHGRPVRMHNKNNLVKMPVNTVKYGGKVYQTLDLLFGINCQAILKLQTHSLHLNKP